MYAVCRYKLKMTRLLEFSRLANREIIYFFLSVSFPPDEICLLHILIYHIGVKLFFTLWIYIYIFLLLWLLSRKCDGTREQRWIFRKQNIHLYYLKLSSWCISTLINKIFFLHLREALLEELFSQFRTLKKGVYHIYMYLIKKHEKENCGLEKTSREMTKAWQGTFMSHM